MQIFYLIKDLYAIYVNFQMQYAGKRLNNWPKFLADHLQRIYKLQQSIRKYAQCK
jgi:hypothetical protein